MKIKLNFVILVILLFTLLGLSAFFYTQRSVEVVNKEVPLAKQQKIKESQGMIVAYDEGKIIIFDEKEGVEKRLYGFSEIGLGKNISFSFVGEQIKNIDEIYLQTEGSDLQIEIGYISMKYNYISFVLDQKPKALLWNNETAFEVSGNSVNLQGLKDGMVGRVDFINNTIIRLSIGNL
jgi:hypothetical protein